MVYQIEKCIGAMAVVLHGEVDAIVLGGGMVHSEDLVRQITETCSFIAPVTAYPGEFEMEAMGAAAARALAGEEQVKTYTGRPVWTGFDFCLSRGRGAPAHASVLRRWRKRRHSRPRPRPTP